MASRYGYWYWLLTIWIEIGFRFKTSFYVGLNVWFLGFKVMVFQVWSDLWGFKFLDHNMVVLV
jgi:hypothetical protein